MVAAEDWAATISSFSGSASAAKPQQFGYLQVFT